MYSRILFLLPLFLLPFTCAQYDDYDDYGYVPDIEYVDYGHVHVEPVDPYCYYCYAGTNDHFAAHFIAGILLLGALIFG